ncbi:hypothetical protein PENSPDRAFT_290740 [Peniophora sp. CONT]|nr:hypothetical protein PENSPDRAFT_290740 [Peniophora sp. CONT]
MGSFTSYRSLAKVACAAGAVSTALMAMAKPIPSVIRRQSTANPENPDAFCVKTMCIAGSVQGNSITYTLTSQGTLPVGWMGIGFGHTMGDSEMVVMWPNQDGSYTISQRRAPYEIEPRPDDSPHAQATLLTESSFVDQMDDSLVTLSFSLPLSEVELADEKEHQQKDIIWAYSIKHPEPEPDAHIAFHDRWGRAKLTLSHDLPPSQSLPGDSSTPVIADDELNGTPLQSESHQRALVAHGILCMAALLLFTPVATVIARWRPESLGAYAVLQVACAGATLLLGLVAAVRAAPTHLDDAHKRVGVLLALLYVGQSALGMYVSRAPNPMKGAGIASVVAGMAVVALALYQTRTGLMGEWVAVTGTGSLPALQAMWWIALFAAPGACIGSLFLGRTREYYIALYSPPLPKEGEVGHEMDAQDQDHYEIGQDEDEEEPEETHRMLSKAQ